MMQNNQTETETFSKTPSLPGDAVADAILEQARAENALYPEVDESKLEPMTNETIPLGLYLSDHAADARARVALKLEAKRNATAI